MLLLVVSLSVAEEKSVYFLLHGLYSSSQGWNTLLGSKEFADNKFTYSGNFHLKENFFDGSKFDVTPELHKSLDLLLQKDNQVFTINFASGYQNDFKQQALQIAKVLDYFPEEGYNYYFVAHSMGGLAARSYIAHNRHRNIKGLITIGTTHLGSYLGHANKRLTSFLGIVLGIGKRPASLLTGISNVWKEGKINVIPSLVPNSDILNELNSHDFPPEIKSISIFSTINSRDEIESLHGNEQLVLQVLQVEKIKSFHSTNPTDMEIAQLYNDLYYTDGIGSIASQNINNAVPNEHEIEAYHIPTRVFHDNEPKDYEHIIPAMRIIKQQYKRRPLDLFIYSNSEEVLTTNNYAYISKMFLNSPSYKANMVVEVEDKLEVVSYNSPLLSYDYALLFVDDSQKLAEMRDRIDSFGAMPIIVDFSFNNNIAMFNDKDCIYIKIINVEEGEKFLKFLSDMLSGKMYVKREEFDQVQEQIVRYYFFTSNLTKRLYIPDYWWDVNLRFFQ